MYTNFFGINEKPFTITPDPRYLFMSERHGEGLAHLVYGVTESGGFIQLTGEVGTGKTTLVRTLLGQIPSEVDIALILNPQLTAIEFLMAICEELGIERPKERYSAKALIDALNRHLLEAHSQGRRTILLIDEAQNLSEDVLEQLRLLTNLETARQKLLQIILIAQPELREKLAQENLRQLAQRVTGRYHLEPLSNEETFNYIDHRLRVAGALIEIFDSAAKREVYRLSGGVPRIINVICDRALLGAYSQESRTVDKTLVRKAASEVSGQKVRPGAMRWLMPALGVTSLIFTGAVLWDNVTGNTPLTESATITVPIEEPTQTEAEPDEPVLEAIPEEAPEEADAPALADIDQLFANYQGSTGYTTLLGLWGVAYDSAAGSACAQAEAAGLRCYFQRGSWGNLRQLDRPVVLTLTSSVGESFDVALTGIDDQSAQLAVADGYINVGLDALTNYWLGQFLLLWRPANDNDQPIGPGMESENVRWLRQSLATIDTGFNSTSGNPDVFDAKLEEQLIAFQRQHRLQADGVAGQKTIIIINSLLAVDDTPRLSSNN
ncbi:MAG: AAA family ATPase [Woeseiaceae bacterium]|nr:AAA family ATPase [Woeseiaceae bacterium]